jgi:hypothetical protein
MVNIWLMMVNNNLVGGFSPTPLKNDGVKVSWGLLLFPMYGKIIKFHGSKPPTRHFKANRTLTMDEIGVYTSKLAAHLPKTGDSI